jgi:predicted phosphodiesterase
MRDRIVTLNSLRPPQGQVESTESNTQANTPEGKLRLARYFQIMQRLERETDETGEDVMITVPDREVSLAQSKLAADGSATAPLASGGQEVQFGTGLAGGDWFGWVWSLTDWVDRMGAHPMLRPKTTTADTLTGDLRLAIAADWGTGLYGAPKCAAAIRKMAETKKFDVAMHLGDVYYSGTENEVEERFLSVWPDDAAAVNRALNGNHEMYSGGFGYFRKILPAFKQDGSYFAMQNEQWLLVGLDTAYVDHDMDTTQVAWLNTVVEQKGNRKVVLFSHQQPFSQLDNQGPKLQAALRHLLEAKRVRAWYWGHQHDCIVYDEHKAWAMFGRCLGNGGIPSARNDKVKSAPADATHGGGGGSTWRRLPETPDAPGCLVLDGKNLDMKKPQDQEKFVPHGFMTLEFQGPNLLERVFLSSGTEIFSNTIT